MLSKDSKFFWKSLFLKIFDKLLLPLSLHKFIRY